MSILAIDTVSDGPLTFTMHDESPKIENYHKIALTMQELTIAYLV
jgi:hypothetical protein